MKIREKYRRHVSGIRTHISYLSQPVRFQLRYSDTISNYTKMQQKISCRRRSVIENAPAMKDRKCEFESYQRRYFSRVFRLLGKSSLKVTTNVMEDLKFTSILREELNTST